MRNGKFRKLFAPFLERNINEEIERFASCLDFDSKRLIFGSQKGCIALWKPSTDKKFNYCKKWKISEKAIEFIHLHGDRLALIEDGNLRVYSLGDDTELVLQSWIYTGEDWSASVSCRLQDCHQFTMRGSV